MRTRLTGFVLLVALLVPAAVTTATAAAAAPADTIVLAADAGETAPGPEPRLADNPENEFRPDDYEEPWTYWLGVVVLVTTIPGMLLVGLLYYLLVHRHRRSTPAAKAGAR